jgi:ATPase family associated with various cellular activities (AAA)
MTLLRDLAVSQLRLRLSGLHCALGAAVQAQIARTARLARPDLTSLCITENEALLLLDDAERLVDATQLAAESAEIGVDTTGELDLQRQAQDAGLTLPLDALSRDLELSAFEKFAVLLCAAPELDRSYERIYAFILDDPGHRVACVELLCTLASPSLTDRVARRHALSRFGKLRRCGVLVARSDAGTELRQDLRLADGLFGYLTGDGSELALLCRDTTIAGTASGAPADSSIERLGAALRTGDVRVAGIWGPQQSGKHDLVSALAGAVGARLRPWAPLPSEGLAPNLSDLRVATQEAVHGGGIVWITADLFSHPAHRDLGNAVADDLARSAVRVVMTAVQPWRPVELIARASYAEIEVSAPNLVARRRMWRDEMPELSEGEAGEMATRLRLGRADVRAAVAMARTGQGLDGAVDGATLFGRLQQATGALTVSRCRQFATLIRPKRGPDDLILPDALHRQVLEVGQFFRAWPMVAENWGFGRLLTGEGGIKALFTGDSGTGKTLAAEVIATQLQRPLLRVELARVVSKWVGETEKNLEAAFTEAEDAQAVLLFDEADALFGKRGEVESGVDRYANLEVSYLLQRLDDYGGLAILASNLKDNIDSAFTRRFHTILHFPRPEQPERLRIWRMAFPDEAPLDPAIDFGALSNLDLTGAGIVGAASTAALLAAEDRAEAIGKSHIVRAIARQFRREARLLTPIELGPYANLLAEAR